MCEPATLDRLVQTVKDLPDEYVAEICDFAEFVKSRRGGDETAYLLNSSANAARLRQAIAELKGGGGQARELLDRLQSHSGCHPYCPAAVSLLTTPLCRPRA